jgi:fused signal recognition particle receptor
MVVGVNSVGKPLLLVLAYQFKKARYNVVLLAADTFRAAAIDQLQIWADRVGVLIVRQNMGSDLPPFDTLQSAVAQNSDIVIIDSRAFAQQNQFNE